jgi:hypothetical protein
VPAAKKTSEHSESKPKRRVVRRKHAPTTDGVSKPVHHTADELSLTNVDKKAISDRVDAITRKNTPDDHISAEAPVESPISKVADTDTESTPTASSDSVAEPAHARDIHQSAFAAESTAPTTPKYDSAPVPVPAPTKASTDAISPVPESSRMTPTPKDAGFLAPAHDTFNLKRNSDDDDDDSGSGWIRKLVYILAVLIGIAAIVLVALTFYAPEILNKLKGASGTEQGQVVDSGNEDTDNGGGSDSDVVETPSGPEVVNIINTTSEIQNYIRSAVSAKYADQIRLTFDNSAATTTQNAVTSDTLYFKTGANTKAVTVQNLLATVGMKVKIEEDSSLKTDFLLALAKTVTPDLSSMTAAVYNANGTPGLAKKYCTILQNYKVASCSAVNATSDTAGITISLKNLALVTQLQRTTDFAKAKFTQAPSNQVQDIVVTVGK